LTRSINTVAARARALIAGSLIVLVAGLAVGCGGGSDSSTTTTGKLTGSLVKPPKPAPPLELTNYSGETVNLDQFQGKAVLVTFIYTHCPDVCPIIVGNLHAAQQQLGSEADKLQIVAVSVDPNGDTPKTVASFLKDHQMAGRMDWLIGSQSQLERTWHTWGIATNVPKKSPEFVEHSAEVFGIDASGTVRALYPANFKPAQIVHDVPILASE
jgi:protein SCO1/2